MPRRRTRPALLVGGLAAALWLGAPAAPAPAADVSVQHGVGAGGDITAGGSITVGLTPAQVLELMREIQAQDSAAVAKVEELSATLGVTNGAVATFLRILGEQEVPTEQLAAKLEEIAQRHVALLQQLQASAAEDPETKPLRDEAAAAVEAGDYDRAEALLTKVREAELAAARRLQEAANERLLNAAAATAEQGELRLAQLDYAGTAARFSEAADLVPASSPLVRADYLNRFGIAARDAGNYPAAEKAFEEALGLREPIQGPDHPHVATALNNLALLYRDQGRYGEAEPLFRRAIAIGEATLGPEHPDVATWLNNVAALYQAQGRYGEAGPLFQRAISISEATLGPEHPDLAIRLNNLAALYRNQGRYGEAEPLFQRALRIFEDKLGPDHPYTVTVRENYAALKNHKP